jgi:hypothetical protein
MLEEIKDSYNYRVVNVSVDEDNKTVYTNKTLVIQLESFLPFLLMEDDILFYKKNVTETIDPITSLNSIKNTITDKEYDTLNPTLNRFVFINEIISPITKNKGRLYYDSKYKDIIFIPTLKTLGSHSLIDGSSDYNNDKLIEVIGYSLGGACSDTVDRELVDISKKLNNNSIFNLNRTKTNITLKVHSILLDGVHRGNSNDKIISKFDFNTDIYYTNPSLTPSVMVELGTVDDLFLTSQLLPTCTVYQYSLSTYRLLYNGTTNTGNNKIYFNIKF